MVCVIGGSLLALKSVFCLKSANILNIISASQTIFSRMVAHHIVPNSWPSSLLSLVSYCFANTSKCHIRILDAKSTGILVHFSPNR